MPPLFDPVAMREFDMTLCPAGPLRPVGRVVRQQRGEGVPVGRLQSIAVREVIVTE